jgi:hypothetical protein
MGEAMNWDVLRDGVQIVLCVVALAGVFLRCRRDRRHRVRAVSEGPRPMFSQEILLQAARQQTEQALAAILSAVETEREKLQTRLPPTDPPAGKAPAEIDEAAPFRLGAEHPPDAGTRGRRPDAGIHALAARGLSVRQIAGQMGVPAGEVDLALRLQHAGERQALDPAIFAGHA